jgi:hypothetical protein
MEIPERVWLQTGEDAADGAADGPTMHNGEMTWCEDRIYKHDTEYVRSDLYAALQCKLEACESKRELDASMERRNLSDTTAKLIAERDALSSRLHKLRPFVAEIWRDHRDPQSSDYNRCEEAECAWCPGTREAQDDE